MSIRKPSAVPEVRVYVSESRRVHIETPFSRLSLTPEEFIARLRAARLVR